MSTRTTILDNTKTVLESIVDIAGDPIIQQVEKNKISGIDLRTAVFPAAFLYLDTQNRITQSSDEAVIGSNTVSWRANLVIECWVNHGDELENVVLPKIQIAMEENYRLNGICAYSRLTSVVHYIIDVEKEVQAVSLNYEVIFRHNRFNP